MIFVLLFGSNVGDIYLKSLGCGMFRVKSDDFGDELRKLIKI